MLRSPFTLSALVLSLAGIVGQVILHLGSDDGIGKGLLWIVAGNAVIGIIVGLRANPIPLTWKKATAKQPTWPWPWPMWAPAGLALAVQAVASVVIAIGFAGQGSDNVLTGIALGVLGAAGAILAGFLVALIVVWPVTVIVSYVLALVRPRPLRTAQGALTVTAGRPEAAGPLLSVLLLLIVALPTFGVSAVSVSGSDSRGERGLDRLWGLLFDYSSAGPVDQPLAWAARGCAVALVVVIVLMIASWSNYEEKRRLARQTTRKAREAKKAAERSAAKAEVRAAAAKAKKTPGA
jgi:hypothetical protein